MGSMQAMDLANLALEGMISKDEALRMHLRGNMLPPQTHLFKVCKKAIQVAIPVQTQEKTLLDISKEKLKLPTGKRVDVLDVIHELRLEFFIEAWAETGYE